MNVNNQENIFWSLAKKYNVFETPSTENSAKLSEAEVPFKVLNHHTETALTIMEGICALKEKNRKLEHEKCVHYHRNRNISLRKMLDDSISIVEKMNVELEFLLHKKHVILHMLQTASRKKDVLPIPVNLQRTFINLLEGLLELYNIKDLVANSFFKLTEIKWDQILLQMCPLKQQTLRNIAIFNKLLYDVCELQNSVDEVLVSMTPFVTSCFDDLESSV